MARSDFNSKKDYYAELGVSENASADEIARAFRDLARSRHPDHGGSEEAMKSLNEAHGVLSNPETRRAYDSERRPPRQHLSGSQVFDPYAASRAGTFGIPVSDPDFAGLVMGALACIGLGLPLLLLVEMQWVFILWPLRLMALGALGVGVYMAHSAMAAKNRTLKAANSDYPRSRLHLHELAFWLGVLLFAGMVAVLFYIRW
jgi:curved DNA-binding protein CbpA